MRQSLFFTKKTCLVPTAAGWLCLVFACLTIASVFVAGIHPFLAPDAPLEGEAIVVEGWLPDYCLEKAAKRAAEHGYKTLFVTGGALESGSYLKEYETYARLGAATLEKTGITNIRIIEVPAHTVRIDRTYASAVALRRWIDSTGSPLRTLDICSKGAHTRRSALLFRRALGKKFRVGTIAVSDRDYEPHTWWKSSEGVREVIGESIAYIYSLLSTTTKKPAVPLQGS